MDLTEFQLSQKQTTPPSGISLALQALWYDAKGEPVEQGALNAPEEDMPDHAGANWVHAYLHRKEGDTSTTRGNWYVREARKTRPLLVPSRRNEPPVAGLTVWRASGGTGARTGGRGGSRQIAFF